MSDQPKYLPLPLQDTISEFYLPSHDLTYHVLAAGNPKQPLVLCLHGFPELAFSWRKIMPAIAAEGYYVVAYDQRGYGYTTGWDTRRFSEVDVNTFSFTSLVRDSVILVNALGYREVACVISHDFGAVVSSMCAVMRPDIFKSVVMMAHPFKGTPVLPFDTIANPNPPAKESSVHKELAELSEPRKHYKWYYSTKHAAPEMDNPESGLHGFLRGYYHLKSADWSGNHPEYLKEWSAIELAKLPYYYVMPLHSSMPESVEKLIVNEDPSIISEKSERWLPDSELKVYVDAFKHNGFQGGLNWYCIATDPAKQKDVELFAGRKIDIPSLFISGKQDWATYQEPGAIENMDKVCTDLKGRHLVDGAGHWVQQEQPEKVIELITDFLKQVKTNAISY
ncbi:Alpha/Beta hydrolase protein [Bisporella sp. PMI_857]|nr:Alpha/Beta hydrolase protein [Bisporella sp. PMI_857]